MSWASSRWIVFRQMCRGVSESTESTEDDDFIVGAVELPPARIDVRFVRRDEAGEAGRERDDTDAASPPGALRTVGRVLA